MLKTISFSFSKASFHLWFTSYHFLYMQLFVNYKRRTVAYIPWRLVFLLYRSSLNIYIHHVGSYVGYFFRRLFIIFLEWACIMFSNIIVYTYIHGLQLLFQRSKKYQTKSNKNWPSYKNNLWLHLGEQSTKRIENQSNPQTPGIKTNNFYRRWDRILFECSTRLLKLLWKLNIYGKVRSRNDKWYQVAKSTMHVW
jgi:hypothetical protein